MQLSIEEFGETTVFGDKQMSVWSEGLSMEWDDFVLSQEDPFLDCGFPIFEFFLHDMDSSLDSEIFTHSYDDLFFVHNLAMQTDDMGKVG